MGKHAREQGPHGAGREVEDRQACPLGGAAGRVSRVQSGSTMGCPVAPGPLQGEAESDLAKYLDGHSEK